MEIKKLVKGLGILSEFGPKDVVLAEGSVKVKGVENLFCNEHLKELSMLGFKCKLLKDKKNEVDQVIFKVEDWSYGLGKEVKVKK